jgi:hypothetical protein
MTGYLAESADGCLPEGWVWADSSEIAKKFALPSAFSIFFQKKDAKS